MRRKRININSSAIFVTVAVLAIFAAFLFLEFYLGSQKTSVPPEGVLSVQYIDVGQGDSTLLTSPEGKYILIDAGAPDSEPALIDHLENAGVETLEYLILTHPHADHIGSAVAVIENFDVEKVLCPDVSANTGTYIKVMECMDNNDCESIVVQPGDVFSFGSCDINIFGPITPDEENLNNASIVCGITYGETRFLFTGDMESDCEEELLEYYGGALKSDVLKVGHHGSSTSSSEEFLTAVAPELAVISCGKDNEYGHPHSEVTKRLKSHGIEYYRTDIDGTVMLVSDGKTVKLHEE